MVVVVSGDGGMSPPICSSIGLWWGGSPPILSVHGCSKLTLWGIGAFYPFSVMSFKMEAHHPFVVQFGAHRLWFSVVLMGDGCSVLSTTATDSLWQMRMLTTHSSQWSVVARSGVEMWHYYIKNNNAPLCKCFCCYPNSYCYCYHSNLAVVVPLVLLVILLLY